MIYNAPYVYRGTREYRKLKIAFFLAEFTIFSILYSVQPLMPYFVNMYNVSETRACLVLSTVALAVAMLLYGALATIYKRRAEY